jgi:hypothetical protein
MMQLMRTHILHRRRGVGGFDGVYRVEELPRFEAPWMDGGHGAVVRCLEAGPSHDTVRMDKCFESPMSLA